MESDAVSLSLFLLIGLVSGFCSSAPLGPINLWLVEGVIKNHIKPLFWFIAGVIVVDVLFACLALWGYNKYLENSPYLVIFQIVTGIFLIVIGLVTFLKLKSSRDSYDLSNKAPQRAGAIRNLGLGMTLCASNPAFLMFWLFVINLMNSSIDVNYSLFGNLIFLAGVALGDGVWFFLLIKIVKKGLNLAKPSILLGIRYSISVAFLGCGVITLWRSLI